MQMRIKVFCSWRILKRLKKATISWAKERKLKQNEELGSVLGRS
jgi:hypothetical protein